MFSAYNKLIVALVGVAVMLGQRYGLDLEGQQGAIVDIIVAVLTAAGVFAAPNKVQP